jgi:chromosome segregation ATPase
VRRDRSADGCSRLLDPPAAAGAHRAAVRRAIHEGRDHAAAATQGIENLACHEAQEAAAAYDYVQESLTDVITQARDLRTKIQSGTVAEKDARKLLADLRKQCAELVAKIAPTKSNHDSAQATLKDPAAKREALINRFPALRR